MAMVLLLEGTSPAEVVIRRAMCVMLQKRNIMVAAAARHDIMLTISATFSTLPKENWVKKLASIIKSGAPGGCPTSILYDERINSPQSQKLAEGSVVRI
jgi:hypothetical protein